MSDERERIENDETGEAGRLESDRNEDDFEGHQLEVGRNEELGARADGGSGHRGRPQRGRVVRGADPALPRGADSTERTAPARRRSCVGSRFAVATDSSHTR